MNKPIMTAGCQVKKVANKMCDYTQRGNAETRLFRSKCDDVTGGKIIMLGRTDDFLPLPIKMTLMCNGIVFHVARFRDK